MTSTALPANVALGVGTPAPFAGVLVPGERYGRQLDLAADGEAARAGGLGLTRAQTWVVVVLYGIGVGLQAYQATRHP